MFSLQAQNLVVDGAISGSTDWNGQEAGNYESVYLNNGCGSNQVMEADQASMPQQVVNGFQSGVVYKLVFRYAWRTSCTASSSPTTLNVRFSDATGVLNVNVAVNNSQTTFNTYTLSFTNNTATTHTLSFTNPGNTTTCGVILDDISISPATSPGGVSTTSLTLWMNASTLKYPDNAAVSCWYTGGQNVVPMIPECGAEPVYFSGTGNRSSNLKANYNAYVTFDGDDDYLTYTSNRLNLSNVATAGNGASVFAVFMNANTNDTYFSQKSQNNSMIRGTSSLFVLSNNGANGTNNRAVSTPISRVNLMGFAGKSNGLTVRDQNGTTLTTSNANADVDYMTVGALMDNNDDYSQYFAGDISEVIVFNTTLSATQMQQVRSYLASKYGVTLSDNSTTTTLDERAYLASNGTTVFWTYTNNTAYHKNVTVIGRDDNSSLYQPLSTSTDADANSRTGDAMLILDNNGAIGVDRSFLAAGHNGSAAANAIFNDAPASIQSRLQRVWKFQKTGTGIGNSVIATFDMTSYTPLTGSDLRLLVSTTASFSAASVITGTYSAPYFSVLLPTTGGVFFTVGSINKPQTPLPIELLSFDAVPQGNEVLVDWKTATELNNRFFTVERSADAMNFGAIGSQLSKAPNGNSLQPLAYTMTDENPLHGISYYRLKQTDIDGSIGYSHKVMVDRSGNDAGTWSVYPNPGDGTFYLDVTKMAPGTDATLTLTDALGRVMAAHTFRRNEGSSRMPLFPELSLAKGVYYLQIIGSNGTAQGIKLIVE